MHTWLLDIWTFHLTWKVQKVTKTTKTINIVIIGLLSGPFNTNFSGHAEVNGLKETSRITRRQKTSSQSQKPLKWLCNVCTDFPFRTKYEHIFQLFLFVNKINYITDSSHNIFALVSSKNNKIKAFLCKYKWYSRRLNSFREMETLKLKSLKSALKAMVLGEIRQNTEMFWCHPDAFFLTFQAL